MKCDPLEVWVIPLTRGSSLLLIVLAIALGACCVPGLGEDVVVPGLPGDGEPSAGSDVAPVGGDTSVDDGQSSGAVAQSDVEQPNIPVSIDDPVVPDPSTEDSTGFHPVETLPPEKDDPFERYLPDNPLIILAFLAVLGAVALYAPGEVQRLRIESAFRESLDARLALARGDFATALAGFDRAIEQAHLAYTRRVRVDRPAEWRLIPDEFYIGLWRGRAQALRGLGRVRTADTITRLADELESVILGSGRTN